MRLFCIIPTLGVFPDAAVLSVEKQTVQPEMCLVAIDEICDINVIAKMEMERANVKCIGDIKRCYAAANIAEAIGYLYLFNYKLKDEDIICLIDGDDWLCNSRALEIVLNTHKAGAWLTYGSYITSTEQRTVIPKKLHRGAYRNHENYRRVPWRASHLKTFRFGLYRKLKEDWWKGPDGEALKVCSDLALMFPMLEMAGKEHIQYINKRLYVYNDENPENDHKVRGAEQKDVEMWLRSQKPYKKISAL